MRIKHLTQEEKAAREIRVQRIKKGIADETYTIDDKIDRVADMIVTRFCADHECW